MSIYSTNNAACPAREWGLSLRRPAYQPQLKRSSALFRLSLAHRSHSATLGKERAIHTVFDLGQQENLLNTAKHKPHSFKSWLSLASWSWAGCLTSLPSLHNTDNGNTLHPGLGLRIKCVIQIALPQTSDTSQHVFVFKRREIFPAAKYHLMQYTSWTNTDCVLQVLDSVCFMVFILQSPGHLIEYILKLKDVLTALQIL